MCHAVSPMVQSNCESLSSPPLHGGARLLEVTKMELSARNQLPGIVKEVKLGAVMAEVILDVAGQEVVSVITRRSAESLGLKVGDNVRAVIKATEVMIGK